ncbi:E3 SUMO-protein ligase ZBED1-like [Leuresthes tenuis]|uniref:E3 SUMO-protein ligase ZBED1-like n=1 Tax=Leuresthes tenuis TaxID=355514 RepID=UPI003B511A94
MREPITCTRTGLKMSNEKLRKTFGKPGGLLLRYKNWTENVQRKTSKDLRKAWRTVAQVHYTTNPPEGCSSSGRCHMTDQSLLRAGLLLAAACTVCRINSPIVSTAHWFDWSAPHIWEWRPSSFYCLIIAAFNSTQTSKNREKRLKTSEMAPASDNRTEQTNRARGQRLRQTRRDHREKRQRGDAVLKMLTLERRLLKMIVSNLLPLEITEKASFRSFLTALKPSVRVPDKAKLRSLLPEVCQEQVKAMEETLASVKDIVLTCELWSSRPEDSHLTVGCHFVDEVGNLKSYTLKTTSLMGDTSAGNIDKQLSGIMKKWSMTEKVHSVVTAGMPQLKQIKTRYIQMPCFADTLNGILKELLSRNELRKVLLKCENIVRFFKHDTPAEKMLRSAQRKVNQQQKELIMYSGDRWLAWLHALQRLIEQYDVVKMVLNERRKAALSLNEKEKKKLADLISALEPLKTATSKMKGKGFDTISVMLPVLTTLMGALREEKGRGNHVAESLLSKCEKEFNGDINAHIGVLDGYLAFKATKGLNNPLTWWKNSGKKKFGELSQFALKKLGIVSTAVPLERAFSIAGDQFCNLRSSMEPENLNMMLFLNSNWR